jgi:isopentenyl diphosphate isomerase/L-lactate dehydrogenase-like FMN-dependent dehydrogenase
MCIAHWAKTYARSRESAGDVADAAIAECADVLRTLSYVSGHEENSIVAPQTPAQLQQSFRKDAIRAVFHYRQAGCQWARRR